MSEAKKNPTLAPLLGVRRGREAIDFYKKAFGATELFRTESEDGAVVAQLTLGESDFWIADESPEHKNYSPETLGGSTVRMVIVADGTEAAARRLTRVLWNDPASGVMRHADAGYPAAIDCARQFNLDLPSLAP